MAHGTYILSVFIALFAGVEALQRIDFPVDWVRQLFASGVLGVFFAVLVYFGGRMYVYAMMLGWVGTIRPMSYEKVVEKLRKNLSFESYVTVTPLLMLHWNVTEVCEGSKYWMMFFSPRYQKWVFLGLLVFLIVAFFLLQLYSLVNLRGSPQ